MYHGLYITTHLTICSLWTPSQPLMSHSTVPHILAVEDNPETQLLLKHLLESAFDVVVVEGVESALAAAQDQHFDILLLDINLSEQRTGIDLLHLLRSKDGHRTTPAIALTAYAMPGDRESFIEEGFDAYVSKPFTRDDLTSAISSVLESKQQA